MFLMTTRTAIALLFLLQLSSPYSMNRAAFLRKASRAAVLPLTISTISTQAALADDEAVSTVADSTVPGAAMPSVTDEDPSFISKVKKGDLDGKSWSYTLPGKWSAGEGGVGFLDSKC